MDHGDNSCGRVPAPAGLLVGVLMEGGLPAVTGEGAVVVLVGTPDAEAGAGSAAGAGGVVEDFGEMLGASLFVGSAAVGVAVVSGAGAVGDTSVGADRPPWLIATEGVPSRAMSVRAWHNTASGPRTPPWPAFRLVERP